MYIKNYINFLSESVARTENIQTDSMINLYESIINFMDYESESSFNDLVKNANNIDFDINKPINYLIVLYILVYEYYNNKSKKISIEHKYVPIKHYNYIFKHFRNLKFSETLYKVQENINLKLKYYIGYLDEYIVNMMRKKYPINDSLDDLNIGISTMFYQDLINNRLERDFSWNMLLKTGNSEFSNTFLFNTNLEFLNKNVNNGLVLLFHNTISINITDILETYEFENFLESDNKLKPLYYILGGSEISNMAFAKSHDNCEVEYVIRNGQFIRFNRLSGDTFENKFEFLKEYLPNNTISYFNDTFNNYVFFINRSMILINSKRNGKIKKGTVKYFKDEELISSNDYESEDDLLNIIKYLK